MIKGIGMDIVEMERIKRLMDKSERFEVRILTPAERERMNSCEGWRRIEFAAGRFAAKEAFVKAAGTGISGCFGFQDIEVLPDGRGKPCIHAGMEDYAHVSITHSRDYAAAQVVLEGRDGLFA
ncbi:holo-ACP synthase [Salibacterium qingdaonense]|uniref:Holo-[acyl-carrier-protein] synthase n=1 Tax=Salibacterium qingdaonense TaxID=266892 RepID=A0A1I4I9G5_9BACI|nr:holo-ACP synthase [Salibacterium qingdaonense]SFL50401.1 holo-[acyl-carrier-protein] synthase [Salibacterium qingdaonense]